MKKYILSAWALLTVCLSLPAQETETLYLSGIDADATVTWNFYCSKGMNSGRWRKIEVPSCWELQGFGEYTYGRYYKKKDGKASDENGKYSYSFHVPSQWNEKAIEIVFEGVMTDATVFINGQQAGETHRGGFTAFSYDVTKLIKPGKKNLLEVNVAKQSSDKSVNAAERRADWWLFGGIYRPVYLRALPKQHIERIAVDARADGTLSVGLYTQGLTAGYTLQTSVDGLGSQTSKLTDATEQTVKTQWTGARLWDPEHPHLYNMTLKLINAEGKEVHSVQQKIGFRTIEFRPRDGFYLNGTKLLMKGVNRHCCYPETGRVPNHRLDLQDVKIIKGMNANAIRSHYPPNTRLLELCDSLGVLYIEELPGWQNHYSDEVGACILREMIVHDVNHPCIFTWSNGNEGGFNLSLDSLFAVYDPQKRHVVHPWALYDGVDTHHYPAYQTGVARLGNGYQVFMPTEFLHSQYDKGAGASLADFWASWSRNPLFAGGFIWAYADEAIVRTDRDGALDSDGGNAPDGIVGPHREKEGSWYTIRDVWSPLQIAPLAVRPGWDGQFTVTNEYLFSNLDEVTMEYQVLTYPSPLSAKGQATITLSAGRIDLPNAAPGESVKCRIALSDEAKKGDVLQMIARNVTGDTVNIWTWPMKYTDEYFATHRVSDSTSQQAKAMVENGNTLVAPNGVRARFDTATGMLTAVYYKDKEIPFNNGPLPVGMKMKLKQVTARHDGSDALLVMEYTGAVDSIVWRMTADGLLGMDALLLNDRKGKGFEGEFFDKEIRNFGFSFSYPESCCSGMRWLGRGPYRVWRNRQQGTNYAIWQKDYNNTVTGDCGKPIVYPEFKGYHANLYWAQMQSETAPFTVLTETDGLYYRVFTPEEPTYLNNGLPTMQPFPEGDLSFLLEIPGIQSYKPIEQLGPQAQPSHVRMNIGDIGLHIKLWFDFANAE